ncbi:MAG: hypothetical protein NZ533_09075 [Casimicrobiaceae bacterium]|nr:hypothetical protein [Casimicrobiaceae bacterium]MDW8312102.1 hypothetical protein [Burkholderiales bacterium]
MVCAGGGGRLRATVMAVFGFTWASFSVAATLFLDLNNAPGEIQALAKALPSSPIIVLPTGDGVPEATRKRIFELGRQFEAENRRAVECRVSVECHPIWERLRALEVERLRLLAGYDVRALARELKEQVVDRGVRLDRVVISGHHSGGYFRGELLELTAEDLRWLELSAPGIFSSVQAVYLFGCETVTAHTAFNLFADVFRQATLIVGAEDNAPTRLEARNLRFIREVVQLEPRLLAAGTLLEMTRLYRQLLQHPWPVSLLWQWRWYFSREFREGAEASRALP